MTTRDQDSLLYQQGYRDATIKMISWLAGVDRVVATEIVVVMTKDVGREDDNVEEETDLDVLIRFLIKMENPPPGHHGKTLCTLLSALEDGEVPWCWPLAFQYAKNMEANIHKLSIYGSDPLSSVGLLDAWRSILRSIFVLRHRQRKGLLHIVATVDDPLDHLLGIVLGALSHLASNPRHYMGKCCSEFTEDDEGNDDVIYDRMQAFVNSYGKGDPG